VRFKRSDRSLLSDWWFTIDHQMFSSVMIIMAGGLVLSLAASPPIALKLGLEPYYFVKRHALFLLPSLLILIASSLLDPRQMRRLSLILVAGGMVLMLATLAYGPEIKGATRWLKLGPFSLQPSEILKPGFVVLSAWLFSESQTRSDVPCLALATGLYVAFATLLIMQPDFGQMLLVTVVWGGLFFLAGVHLFWVTALAGLAIVGMVVAYFSVSHVAMRVDSFLNPASGDTYQIDNAHKSFVQGGWFGRGPGEGQVKQVLPDSHTDFIFAVAAEEYGLIACLVLVAVFAFIVLRGMRHTLMESEAFIRHAVAGLMMLFGLQTLINVSVNLGLLPAKGMTLPFISYGGSSLISMALTLGLALGLMRRRPSTVSIARRIDMTITAHKELKA